MFNEMEDFLEKDYSPKDIKAYYYARYSSAGIGGADIRFFAILFEIGNEEVTISLSNGIGGSLFENSNIKEIFAEFSELMFKLTEKHNVTFIGDKMHAAWIDSVHQLAYCNKEVVPYKKDDMQKDCFALCKYSDFTGTGNSQQHQMIDLPTLFEMQIKKDYYSLFARVDSNTFQDLRLNSNTSQEERLAVSKVKSVKFMYDHIRNNIE